jgi:hypothetical protein
MPKIKPKSGESAARPATPGEASQAFARVQDQIAAIADDELLSINVDIPRAVSIVLGALPGITGLLPELKQLPLKPVKLEQLRDYAFAAWYAHLAATATTSESDKKALLAEAGALRDDLLVAAEALAHKGLLDPTTVADIRAGSGNTDRANDLVALGVLFTNAWERVRNKTTVTWEDVEKASDLGPRLFMALAERPADAPAAVSIRARAFTLMARTYDQARRGVTYLRWNEDDADLVAPSIYAGRQRKRASAEKPDPAPDTPTAESGPPLH